MPHKDPEKYRAWYERTAARRKELRNQSYQRTKQKHSEYNKRRYQEKRVENLARKRAYHSRSFDNPTYRAQLMWNAAKQRARKKGLKFTLTQAWVELHLRVGFCELTSLPFVLMQGRRPHPHAPTIDRKDAALGYSEDNCRVVLWCLNLGFGDWGLDAVASAWQTLFANVKVTNAP